MILRKAQVSQTVEKTSWYRRQTSPQTPLGERKQWFPEGKPSGNWTWIFKCSHYIFIFWRATEFQQWHPGTVFQEMIFHWVYHGSAVTQHPKAGPELAEVTLREKSYCPSSWFSIGSKKMLWKLWLSYMPSAVEGFMEGGKSSLGLTSISRWR